jgi:F-type H+-transporting ATPase subunit delta
MSVATTYADALHAAAADQEAVGEVSKDLRDFCEAVTASTELAMVLESPGVEARERKAVVEQLTAGAHPLFRNFLRVLLDRGRIADLADIERALAARVSEAEGRIVVHAITAVPLSDDLRELIRTRVEEKTGRRVDLSESVDEEIIGGLVLQVEGAVVDASLRHRLGDLGAAMRSARIEAVTAA